MNTVAGTGRLVGSEELTATVIPSDGAGPVRRRESVTFAPVFTVFADGTMPAIWVGIAVSELVTEPCVVIALTVSEVFTETQPIFEMTAASLAPAGTVMVVGSGSTVGCETVSFTCKPPAGAGPFKYAFTKMLTPSDVDEGVTNRLLTAAGACVMVTGIPAI